MFQVAQLWVNLPAKDKMSPPRYQAITDGDIPHAELPSGAGTARVIAGELLGVRGPAKTFTPVNVWDVQLNADAAAELRVPEGHTAIAVVQSGSVTVPDQPVNSVALVLFERSGGRLQLAAQSDSRLLVLTGQPIGEPVVGQGPFVMNTREEIRQAIVDYQAGRMGHLN
jgi:redox-sensitive bicupin YhaK (pirin superfamily)